MLWDPILSESLNWEVIKRPIFDKDGVEIKNKVEIVRSDTMRHINVVGTDYTPVQNAECMEFIAAIPDARIEKMGTFGKGCKVWWAVKLPGELHIAGDVLYKYSIMVNAHDGSLGFRWFITPIRPACSNMMNMLIRSAIDFNISARHTRNVKTRIIEAKKMFQRVNTVYAELQTAYTDFVNQDFVTNDLQRYVESVLRPVDAKHGRFVTAYKDIEYNYSTCGYMGKKWGALNAMTQYLDHQRPMRGESQDERRFANAIYGTTATLKQLAYNMLLEEVDGPNYLHYVRNGIEGSVAEECGIEEGP